MIISEYLYFFSRIIVCEGFVDKKILFSRISVISLPSMFLKSYLTSFEILDDLETDIYY